MTLLNFTLSEAFSTSTEVAKTLKILVVKLTVCAAFSTMVDVKPMPPDWRHTLSFSKGYSAELTDGNEKLSVYRREESGPILLWTHSLKREGETRWTREQSTNFELVVADDGATVALHCERPFDESPALRLITRAGGDFSFGEEDIKDPKCELTLLPSFRLFVGEPANVYAIWQEYSARWLVFDLQELRFVPASHEKQLQIDTEALERARELARLALPGPLKRIARSIRATAAEYVPSVAPAGEAELDWTIKAALRYLAHRRQPPDKAVIERLLDSPLKNSTPGYARFTSGEKLAALDSDKRALGDELLSIWDGKKVNGWRQPGLRNLNFLGGIGGTVRLPFRFPAGAGDIWIYLIPNTVSKKNWASNPEVLKIRSSLLDEFGEDQELPLDRLRFAFDTIPAGEYRLRAVWDRAAPFAEKGPEAIAVGQKGDYESVESSILLQTGTAVLNLVIDCTNSIGQAANDNTNGQGATALSFADIHPDRVRPQRREPRAVVDRPVTEWILRTNLVSKGTEIRRIALQAEDGHEAVQGAQSLLVTFKWSPESDHSDIRAQLTDKHGCRFVPQRGVLGRLHELSFSHVPFGAPEFHLEIWSLSYKDSAGQSYTNGPLKTELVSVILTNLSNVQPANWPSVPTGWTQELGDVQVTLAHFDPATVEEDHYLMNPFGYEALQPRATRPFRSGTESFFRFSGKAGPQRWLKVGGKFVDRWGNEGRSIQEFCKHERLLKYEVLFAREPETGIFSSHERTELLLQQVPGPGEAEIRDEIFMVNGVPVRLLAVAGTGEFIYKDGQFITGQKEIRKDDFFATRFLPKSDLPSQKFHVIEELMGERNDARGKVIPERSIVLVSRVPHISVRFPPVRRGIILSLLEHDRSISGKLRASGPPSTPRSEQRFVPLSLASGEGERKLTFIVQEAIKAEFVVQVPLP